MLQLPPSGAFINQGEPVAPRVRRGGCDDGVLHTRQRDIQSSMKNILYSSARAGSMSGMYVGV